MNAAGPFISWDRSHHIRQQPDGAMLDSLVGSESRCTQVAANVVFIHPDHNLAVLQYSPQVIHPTISSGLREANLSTATAQTSDEVRAVLHEVCSSFPMELLVNGRLKLSHDIHCVLPPGTPSCPQF